ncbi:hypothetical protein BREVNS_2038 [Brevinematales bacterium NS]|nr:hypothetical protein BREVNS_2038 [Brevinematales bacterium NS]
MEIVIQFHMWNDNSPVYWPWGKGGLLALFLTFSYTIGKYS